MNFDLGKCNVTFVIVDKILTELHRFEQMIAP